MHSIESSTQMAVNTVRLHASQIPWSKMCQASVGFP